jgi:hypothetical protein
MDFIPLNLTAKQSCKNNRIQFMKKRLLIIQPESIVSLLTSGVNLLWKKAVEGVEPVMELEIESATTPPTAMNLIGKRNDYDLIVIAARVGGASDINTIPLIHAIRSYCRCPMIVTSVNRHNLDHMLTAGGSNTVEFWFYSDQLPHLANMAVEHLQTHPGGQESVS